MASRFQRFSRLLGLVGEGNRQEVRGAQKRLIQITSVLLTGYMLWFAVLGRIDVHVQGAIFLGVMLPVTFLSITLNGRVQRQIWLDYVLAVLSVIVCTYFVYNREFYITFFEGLTPIPPREQAAGIALTMLTFEACRRAIGIGLTSVLAALLLFVPLGPLLSGLLHHAAIPLDYFVTMQTVTTNGIFGAPLQVAAGYAFLFVLFGTFFHYSGGGRLLFEVSAAVTGRMTGGSSKACVVASGLYGSLSGSPVADVSTTGPVTIPLMKRAGSSSVRAAATEAAASSGGAFLPPVMGAVAFLMVEYTGIPYRDILASALMVGLLYYGSLFLAVHLEAKREGEGVLGAEHLISLNRALRRNWYSLIPLAVLIYFLLAGYSPIYVAAAATGCTLITSWFGPDHIGPKRFVDACTETVLRMSSLTAAVAAAGVVMGAIALTGLEGKFTLLLMGLSGGLLVPTLILAAIVLILLGMGMPTPAVYVMGVALLAPLLTGVFELPILESHLFLLYFSCMSAITPPVAVACFAAGAIADARPMAVAVHASRLAIVGFVLPFYLIFHPGVVLAAPWASILLDFVLGMVMVAAVTTATIGFTDRDRKLGPAYRLSLIVSAIGIFWPELWITLPAAALALVLMGHKFLPKVCVNRQAKTAAVPAKHRI